MNTAFKTTVNYTDELYPDSTLVEGAYYDARTQELVVDLNDALYLYKGVPKETFLGLETASSAGRYYATAIKSKFGPGTYLGREWNVTYNEVEVPVGSGNSYPNAVGTPKGLTLSPALKEVLETRELVATSSRRSAVETPRHLSLVPAVGTTRKYTVTFLDARGEVREHTVHATGLDEAIVTVLDIGDMLNLDFTVKSVTVYFE